MDSESNLLEVRGVKMVYATLTALDGVDLTVTRRLISWADRPQRIGQDHAAEMHRRRRDRRPGNGHVPWPGHHRATPSERSRAGMSLKFQITSILPSLSVYDNVLLALQAQDSMAALMFSRTRGALHERAMDWLAQFHLDGRPDELAGALSHGQQQWLEIAMALSREPRLLLLDEPTAGMSPQERRATGELLAPIRERCSLLIVEHDLDFIKDICDTLTVLDQGRVVDSGSTRDVQNSEKVKEVYLAHV